MSAVTRIPPPAFVCSESGHIMKFPVLALCGHLFEEKVALRLTVCKQDGFSLKADELIRQPELKKRIAVWELAQHPLPTTRGASSTASNRPSGRADVEGDWRRIPKGKQAAPARIAPAKVVAHAHADDIHAMIPLSGGGFATGSKDTTIGIWDNDGNLVKRFSSDKRDYNYWITAMAPLSNGGWASGTRDGAITIWNKENQVVKTIVYQPKNRDGVVCKERNKARINCLREWKVIGGDTMLFSGTPEFVQVWNCNTGRLAEYYKARDNDWVYCTEPLPNDDLLVVIGAEMEKWRWDADDKIQKEVLIQETREEKRAKQRPHISSIVRCESNTSHVAAALFNGKLKIVDIETKATVKTYEENRGRLWTVINLQPHVLASCCDDQTIKLWDVRQAKSIMTVGNQGGRVSTLLRLTPELFISGACPDNPHGSCAKGTLSFWDMRQFSVLRTA